MAVIKYTLDSGSVPSYISDGGYFPNPADNTLIGIGSGGGTTIASKSDLNTYVLSLHASIPYGKYDNAGNVSDMTDSEVTTWVNNWCRARGIS